jgi:hypothetical protein
VYLAREGFSYATLKDMPETVEEDEVLDVPAGEPRGARSRVPG